MILHTAKIAVITGMLFEWLLDEWTFNSIRKYHLPVMSIVSESYHVVVFQSHLGLWPPELLHALFKHVVTPVSEPSLCQPSSFTSTDPAPSNLICCRSLSPSVSQSLGFSVTRFLSLSVSQSLGFSVSRGFIPRSSRPSEELFVRVKCESCRQSGWVNWVNWLGELSEHVPRRGTQSGTPGTLVLSHATGN